MTCRKAIRFENDKLNQEMRSAISDTFLKEWERLVAVKLLENFIGEKIAREQDRERKFEQKQTTLETKQEKEMEPMVKLQIICSVFMLCCVFILYVYHFSAN